MKRNIVYLLIGIILGYLCWVTMDLRYKVDSNGIAVYPTWLTYIWIPIGFLGSMFIGTSLRRLVRNNEVEEA